MLFDTTSAYSEYSVNSEYTLWFKKTGSLLYFQRNSTNICQYQ